MDGFFTWQTLMTYSGATLATALITQFIKETGLLKRLPMRLVSYFAALLIMLASTLALRGAAWEELAMAVINAVVVALASNGAFDAVNAAAGK
jgi:hypothetical protein